MRRLLSESISNSPLAIHSPIEPSQFTADFTGIQLLTSKSPAVASPEIINNDINIEEMMKMEQEDFAAIVSQICEW